MVWDPDNACHIYYPMIEKTQEIKNFLSKHFCPGTEDNYTFYKNNHGVLNMLFDVFPEGCIDDYELHEIMMSLGYTPVKISKTEKVEKKKDKVIIGFYWCLKSI